MSVYMEEKKDLSAGGLLQEVQQCFKKIKSSKRCGAGKAPEISHEDCLMSGLVIFGLKFPSLLQFDLRKKEEVIRHKLKTLYGVERAPCSTQLRERLDEVDLACVQESF